MEYKEISANFVSKFNKLVDNAHNITITAHENPDEDSISSVLATYEIISINFPQKNTRIVYSSDPDTKYKIFKHFDKIEFVDDIANHLSNTDLLIMVDGNNYYRFSKKEEVLKRISHTICIDHHSSPIEDFTLSLVVPQYPSCAEVIYRSLFTNVKIDKPLAEIFLLGILGDTGNFTYLKENQLSTLTIAQKLLEIGQIEIQEFQSRYRSISPRIFKVIQEFIKNTHYSSVENWPDFQYSFITRKYSTENNLTRSEISEASHRYSSEFIRTIEGYTWGFVITPDKGGDINISCRSLPNSVNVREFMEKQKIGGGHDRASGGTFYKKDQSLEVADCIEKIFDWIKSNKPSTLTRVRPIA
ncbi:MAG TPA: DHH family phosphoesterase [Spirochaetia bacterium]|nr:DHH family phosphoesterase [Spirochaetia bacterium]